MLVLPAVESYLQIKERWVDCLSLCGLFSLSLWLSLPLSPKGTLKVSFLDYTTQPSLSIQISRDCIISGVSVSPNDLHVGVCMKRLDCLLKAFDCFLAALGIQATS